MFTRVCFVLLVSGLTLFAQSGSSDGVVSIPDESPLPKSPFVDVLESNTPAGSGISGKEKEGRPSGAGGGGMGDMSGIGAGGMGGGRGGQSPGYRITYAPTRETRTPFAVNNPNELSYVQQQLNLGMPLYMDKTEMVLGIFSLRHTWFDTEAVLPDTRRPFPDTLTNAMFGLMYSHKFEDGWSGGALLSVSSPSDKPFNGLRELNPMIVGFVRIPVVNQRDAWNLSIFYSPASQLQIPLPGVAYSWNPSSDFRWNIGIPMNLFWRFAPDWTYEFTFLPITNVTSRTTWKPTDDFSLYGAFEWQNDTYLLSGRANRTDRFFIDEKRFELGAIFKPYKNWSITTAVGYAFDRKFFQGDGFFDNNVDRINLNSGPYATIQIGYQFGGPRGTSGTGNRGSGIGEGR